MSTFEARVLKKRIIIAMSFVVTSIFIRISSFNMDFGATSTAKNVFINDIKLILTHSIIENSIDKLTIINHLRNEQVASPINSESQYERTQNTEKNQKKLEINAINKMLHKLKENGNAEKKLNIESLVNASNSSSSNQKSNKLQFLSVIRCKKKALQKVLESALKECEMSGGCQSLNKMIQSEQTTLRQRNEMFAMVKQLKNKSKCLQNRAQCEEKEFKSDSIHFQKRIVSLKEQISSQKKQIEIDQKLKKYELTAQLNTNQRQNKILEQSLNNKLEEIRKELKREKETFKATQKFLKKKFKVLESECIQWQQKYDDETTTHKNALQQITNKREVTLCALQTAQIEYDREQTIYKQRIEAEKKKKALEEKVYFSAILIQKMTRGFLVRRRLKKEKDRKKKSKKSKKGKKKKGKKTKK